MDSDVVAHCMDGLVCRFFTTTGCHDGDDCLFPHVISDTRVPDTICRYFLKGQCIFGGFCRFDHVVVFRSNTSEPFGELGAVYWMNAIDMQSENLTSSPKKYKLPALLCAKDATHGFVKTNAAAYESSGNWFHYHRFLPTTCNTEEPGDDAMGESSGCTVHYHPLISTSDPPEPGHPEDRIEISEGLGVILSYKLCAGEDSCPLRKQVSNSRWTDRNILESLEVHLQSGYERNQIDPKGRMKCGLCCRVVCVPSSVEDCQFGLLQMCNHVYCLSCILSWNGVSGSKNKSCYRNVNVRCPQCSTVSRNILPSHVWMTHLEKGEPDVLLNRD